MRPVFALLRTDDAPCFVLTGGLNEPQFDGLRRMMHRVSAGFASRQDAPEGKLARVIMHAIDNVYRSNLPWYPIDHNEEGMQPIVRVISLDARDIEGFRCFVLTAYLHLVEVIPLRMMLHGAASDPPGVRWERDLAEAIVAALDMAYPGVAPNYGHFDAIEDSSNEED